ncbi:hypothetical protein QQS21_003600 [Conoideocrella luteorostrata]|uniref:Secreted protein n=1 Tax=Conoideocrella luteorostrata TaxID=1105319 RepID=A0AAJ0G0G2_9HYPO|nr:hypothetical protein QQS21_003600 [Conoideocrella luteorostrata]
MSASLWQTWLAWLVFMAILVTKATSRTDSAAASSKAAVPSVPNIITGLRGNPAQIQIIRGDAVSTLEDAKTGSSERVSQKPLLGDPQPIWTWDTKTGVGGVSSELTACIQRGTSSTDAKFAANGKKIVAIIGYSAIVIGYDDKKVEYGVCLDGPLWNTHTAELLPGNLLAVGTNGPAPEDGIWVYNATKMDKPSPQKPIQKLKGVRALHGLVWDQQEQTLWAGGNTLGVDGSYGPSHCTIQGYKYDKSTHQLTESLNLTSSLAARLNTEWAGTSFAGWWEGTHDLVPVPDSRLLLFTTDREIHAVDLKTGIFNHSGEQLAAKFVKGFVPVDERKGQNGELLPRSDIKALGLHPQGGVIYTQAAWRKESGIPTGVNHLSISGKLSQLYNGKQLYKSRWFAATPGWPTA